MHDRLVELLQQQPRALSVSDERREECERVDDAPPTYAEGAGRGDGGNEQIYVGQGVYAIIKLVGNTALSDLLPTTRWVRPCLRADGSCNSSRTKREARSVCTASESGVVHWHDTVDELPRGVIASPASSAPELILLRSRYEERR